MTTPGTPRHLLAKTMKQLKVITLSILVIFSISDCTPQNANTNHSRSLQAQDISPDEAYAFFKKWYKAWDGVFEKRNESARKRLVSFATKTDLLIDLPSRKITSSSEFDTFLKELQNSDITDSHQCLGFKKTGPKSYTVFVDFKRLQPKLIEMQTTIELELFKQAGKVKIKMYRPVL